MKANAYGSGRSTDSDGYSLVAQASHPRARQNGYVAEHILIAEAALGHALPPQAVVHHSESKQNNRALVICENLAYHNLLHQRQRALDACGNANWRKCHICKTYDDPARMSIHTSGRAYHRACDSAEKRRRKNGR